MKVLLSIRPEYVEKIFSGEKTHEFRRTVWKKQGVDSVIIYCTAPVKKIVGEFKIDKIIKDDPVKLWNLDPDKTGIDRESFLEYFWDKKEGYAIKIGATKKYEKPIDLLYYGFKNAPQSFVYIK